MGEFKSRGWRIYGRVQGVGFRYFVVREAEKLGLVGWTANLSDGSVEVRAGGKAKALERFRESLARGPAHSIVERVAELEFVENLEKVRGFAIRYVSA